MTRLTSFRKNSWSAAWMTVLGASLACGFDSQPPESRFEHEAPTASLFAVGDTGRPHRWFAEFLEGQISVANGMNAEDERVPVDALLLLGDNFYDAGLQRETMADQIRENIVYPYCQFVALNGPRSEEVREACSRPADREFPPKILAVFGNHDIATPGSADLECQEVKDFVSNWHLPCGFSELVELGNGISVILFDSEREPTRRDVEEAEEALRNSLGPWRVIAAHRPISLDDDSRPLKTDHWVNQIAERTGIPIHAFVSGHHHNLQLLESPGPSPWLHIIAGSGARARARPPDAVDHPHRRYGASKLGFARIDVVKSGEEERLLVSLFETPNYPMLASGSPKLVSRWSVDQAGNTRDELTSDKNR